MAEPSIAIYEHGALQCAEGLAASVLDRARQGLELSPDDGHLLALAGVALRHLGRLPEACAALEAAACEIPLPPAAALALGECYLHQKKPDVARVIVRHLAAQSEIPFHLLAPLASALGRLQECELALAVCRSAAARAPEADEPLFAMAYFLRRLGRPPEVILPVLEQALRLAPDTATYRLALAGVLAELSDYDKARHVLAPISIDCVGCISCLARLEAIFAQAGDEERREHCADRARSLKVAGEASAARRCS